MEARSVASSTLLGGVSSQCEQGLQELYRTTYYNLLSAKCTVCHTNGPGVGKFGHPDLTISYNAFRSIARSKIESRAVDPAHNSPYTGPGNQAAVNSYKPQWDQADAQVANCLANENANGLPVYTAAIADAKIIQNASNPNTWTTLTFDMDTNPYSTSLKIPIVVTIEVRVAVIGGVRRGYEVRNPTFKLKAGAGAYQVDEIHILVNNNLQADVTVYDKLSFMVQSTTAMNVAPNSAYGLIVLAAQVNTDKFSLKLGRVLDSTGKSVGINLPAPVPTVPVTTTTTTMPPATTTTTMVTTTTTMATTTTTRPPTTTTTMTPVPTTTTTMAAAATTWTQLVSTDATKGIFKQSCLGCHSGGTILGGLDLGTYSSAKSSAGDILSRMQNTSNPMPPSGVLGTTQINQIKSWVNGGTPQ